MSLEAKTPNEYRSTSRRGAIFHRLTPPALQQAVGVFGRLLARAPSLRTRPSTTMVEVYKPTEDATDAKQQDGDAAAGTGVVEPLSDQKHGSRLSIMQFLTTSINPRRSKTPIKQELDQ